MLRGVWLCLAALWLVGASPPHPHPHPHPHPEGGSRLDPGGATHDHSQGFAYDHEAFLGKEGARTFDQLPPHESQRRLGLLVEAIDAAGDGDGRVSAPELRRWMGRTQRRARDESLSRSRQRYDRDGDGRVTWQEYRHEAYGDGPGGRGAPPAVPAAAGAGRAAVSRRRRRRGRGGRRARAGRVPAPRALPAHEAAAGRGDAGGHGPGRGRVRAGGRVHRGAARGGPGGDPRAGVGAGRAAPVPGGPRPGRRRAAGRGGGGALAAPPQRRLAGGGGRPPPAPLRPRQGRAADQGRDPEQLGAVRGQPGHQLWAGPGAAPRRALRPPPALGGPPPDWGPPWDWGPPPRIRGPPLDLEEKPWN